MNNQEDLPVQHCVPLQPDQGPDAQRREVDGGEEFRVGETKHAYREEGEDRGGTRSSTEGGAILSVHLGEN